MRPVNRAITRPVNRPIDRPLNKRGTEANAMFQAGRQANPMSKLDFWQLLVRRRHSSTAIVDYLLLKITQQGLYLLKINK